MKRNLIFGTFAGIIALTVVACGDVEWVPGDDGTVSGGGSASLSTPESTGKLLSETSTQDILSGGIRNVVRYKINTELTNGKTGFWAAEQFNCGTFNPDVTYRQVERNGKVIGQFLTIATNTSCTNDQVQVFNTFSNAQQTLQ